MTAPSQIFAGGRILAAVVRGVAPLSAYKSVIETVSNSNTLQPDDALLLPNLVANAVYAFECVFAYQAGAQGSSDIRFGWTVPSGATMGYSVEGNSGGSAAPGVWGIQSTTFTQFSSAGTGVPVSCEMKGTLAMSSTAGTLQFQWAQHTATASFPTSVLPASSLLAWQIA